MGNFVGNLGIGVFCTGLAFNPKKTQEHTISFPAYQDGKTEYNEQIYHIDPFALHISLPKGWSAALPVKEERDASLVGFTPVYLMENGEVQANRLLQYV